MIDTSVTTNAPRYVLNAQQVAQAVASLCASDQFEKQYLPEIERALAEPDHWEKQIKRLRQFGWKVYHLKTILREIQAIPGQLALLHLKEGVYWLLKFQHQQWQFLDADAETQGIFSDELSEQYVEAMIFKSGHQHSEASSVLTNFGQIWLALKSTWLEVGFASLLINIGLLLLPLFSMLVYDKVVSNGVFETLWALALGMAIYLVTDTMMRVVRAWSIEHVAEDIARKSDEGLWQKIVAQNDASSGFARFLSNYRDLAIARDFVSSTYLLALADLPFLLLYLLAVGIIAWPLVIVASLLVLFYVLLAGLLQMRSNRLSREAEQKNTKKLSFMGEVLSSLDIVRTVPKSNYFLRNWRELSEDSAKIDSQRRLTTAHTGTLAASMMTLTTVIMLVSGTYLIDARSLSVGGLIACSLLTSRAMSLVTSLFMVVGKWQDFQRASKRMESIIRVESKREYTSRQFVVGQISVIQLSKKYPERPVALDDVSFTLTPGERVALLGRPGAGKSTLLHCIAGLSKQEQGQVLIDGLALDDISREDRAKWMAWKAQDPALFAGTLEENLMVAGSPAGSERFMRAIWASGLEDEIKSGRMSLGMQLEERGSNLSGGQRQKVALARVLAQPSQILLLDEPTLGLDPDSERMLAERLPQVLKESDILIMTTHSAIMLNVAKRVIALDAGRIIADGEREKLVRVS